MERGLHFISGLPRSGSTLLAAILLQNPNIHAGMSSPVASLVLGMQRQLSQDNEGAYFIDDNQREAILRGVFVGYYERLHREKVILDTNRAWSAKLPLLARLFPQAKMIACVRDIGWIMDSFERLIRSNALELSRIFAFDAGGTVFSRVDTLGASGGLVGFALDALREAFFGEHARQMMLVTYETLTAEPQRTLEAIYDFLDLPAFAHDFDNVSFHADEFDRRIGTPGLHTVKARVVPTERRTILPPGLFARYAGDAFWRDSGANINGVRII